MNHQQTIGVLALQGAFIEHEQKLTSLGLHCREIRQRADLDDDLSGLVLPGGESSVQKKLLRDLSLFLPLQERIRQGMPVLATCAGLILLAEEVEGETPRLPDAACRSVPQCLWPSAWQFHDNRQIRRSWPHRDALHPGSGHQIRTAGGSHTRACRYDDCGCAISQSAGNGLPSRAMSRPAYSQTFCCSLPAKQTHRSYQCTSKYVTIKAILKISEVFV